MGAGAGVEAGRGHVARCAIGGAADDDLPAALGRATARSREKLDLHNAAPGAVAADVALREWRTTRSNADSVPAYFVLSNAQLEGVAAAMPADARELLGELGQSEPGLDQLAKVGFETLGLQTYLTAGPKESRAWTIRKGATAPEAAGVIHTDFQRGFIKAEIVSFEALVDAGSMAEARARGKVRIEGKDYVMADGDVVEFRFNV